MAPPLITVLTQPVYCSANFVSHHGSRLRRAGVRLRLEGPHYQAIAFGGHPAVTRSVMWGLRALRVPHNYNPRKSKQMAPIVLVLSGVEALERSILLKKQGDISRLFAGPNIVEFADDANEVLAEATIDRVLVPSEWVGRAYETQVHRLKGKWSSWAAGVDPTYWDPAHFGSIKRSPPQVLFFVKRTNWPEPPFAQYVSVVRRLGLQPKVIEYGRFSHSTYRKELRKSIAVIGFSASESQGIAWLEAWAMDVPTFVAHVGPLHYRDRVLHSSPAPYLNDQTGAIFRDVMDLEILIGDLVSGHSPYGPRAWVLGNMSDQVAASRLWTIMAGGSDRSRGLANGALEEVRSPRGCNRSVTIWNHKTP